MVYYLCFASGYASALVTCAYFWYLFDEVDGGLEGQDRHDS